LAIEVHGHPVVLQLAEYRRQRRASPKSLGRLRVSAVGENDKLGVLGKQCQLTGNIAPIRAIGVNVKQFPNRQPVGRLRQRHISMTATSLNC
jgi:hypothetical protein